MMQVSPEDHHSYSSFVCGLVFSFITRLGMRLRPSCEDQVKRWFIGHKSRLSMSVQVSRSPFWMASGR